MQPSGNDLKRVEAGLGTGPTTPLQVGTLDGREVRQATTGQKVTGSLCCLIALGCIISGGVMWGTCNDPTIEGCSEVIKKVGIGLASTGIVLISAEVLLITCVFCCALGIACCVK